MSVGELLIVMVVALIVFGPERVPALTRTIARWVVKVRHLQQHLSTEIEQQIQQTQLEKNQQRAQQAEKKVEIYPDVR